MLGIMRVLWHWSARLHYCDLQNLRYGLAGGGAAQLPLADALAPDEDGGGGAVQPADVLDACV